MANKTYIKAINEAIDLCMKKNRSVFIIGEGVPDPKRIFGTTAGLIEKYGPKRVMDMPLSENGLTGVCVGAALNGLRPILTHQRMDFSLLALDQVINSAAKWHYMFGNQQSIPLVIKMIIGMGWGQGPQHSQNFQTLYAHIPGLKVVMPVTPYDAKGLMISSIEDNNPVIFIEHRWLHNVFGPVPDGIYRVPIGKARIAKKGQDITIVSVSYMIVEALKAADLLEKIGLTAEIIDVRTVKPLDEKTIFSSLKKTQRLLVADLDHKDYGFAAEIIARATENKSLNLLTAPCRITLPDIPTPTTPALTEYYYPRYTDIARKATELAGGNIKLLNKLIKKEQNLNKWLHDVPDENFTGPF